MLANNNDTTYQADAQQGKLEKLFAEFFAFDKNMPTGSSTPWRRLQTFMKLRMKW